MPNFSEAKIKAVAEQSWWKYTGRKKLAEAHNLTEDQIDNLRNRDEYKEYVFNRLVSQWPTLEEFDKWIKSFNGEMPKTFGRRMGIKPEDVEVLVKRAREVHAEIDTGKTQAPKPITDPFKRDRNYRYTLYREQKRKCNLCRKIFEFADMTLDHKTPTSRGGAHEVENWQLLCQSCNSSKGVLTQEEWDARDAIRTRHSKK